MIVNAATSKTEIKQISNASIVLFLFDVAAIQCIAAAVVAPCRGRGWNVIKAYDINLVHVIII